MSFVYPDFNFSLDYSEKYGDDYIADFDMDLYLPGRADDIIAYMEENGIEMPKFDKTPAKNLLQTKSILAGKMMFNSTKE